MKYVCPVCGYVYDEEKEGRPFSELPDTWTCLLCGAAKALFKAEKGAEVKPQKLDPVHFDSEMTELSAAELSVICSNLARGCEKQYNEKARELYTKLSEYFKAVTPEAEDAKLERLAELIKKNLEEDYPVTKATAEDAKDRGTQRICVWGEKVTTIISTLLERYEKEGESFLEHTNVWVCSVCGFIYVGDEPPKICPVCKVPDWKFDKIEGRRA